MPWRPLNPVASVCIETEERTYTGGGGHCADEARIGHKTRLHGVPIQEEEKKGILKLETSEATWPCHC